MNSFRQKAIRHILQLNGSQFSKNVRNKYFLSVISQGPLCCDETVKTPGFLGRANFPNFPHLKAAVAVVSFMFKSFLCSP